MSPVASAVVGHYYPPRSMTLASNSSGLPKTLPRSKLDADAVSVCRRLQAEGHIAYLVGGCVRDIILGRDPKDFDVGTSATPAQVRNAFRNCRLIGRRFRLAHVHFGPKIIEVATFRGGRGGDESEANGDKNPGDDELIVNANNFGTPEQDAVSRDFTVNGLFYDPISSHLIDNVNGYVDICDGVIRTIGEPVGRFREDPVRIMRAVKFAARLGFKPDEDTWAGMQEVAPDVLRCSAPRVTEEIYRILEGRNLDVSVRLMYDLGLLDVMFAELAEYIRDDEAAYFDYLEVAASIAEAHHPLPRDFLMTLIYFPLLIELVQNSDIRPGVSWGAAVEEWFRPIGVRMHVAVKHRSRMRTLMGLLGRFLGPPRARGRFRISQHERYAMPQALTLLRVYHRVHGGCEEIYNAWRDNAAENDLSWVPVSQGPKGGRKPAKRGSRRGGRSRPRGRGKR